MSSISILGGDWEILFDDERTTVNAVQGMKTIRKAVATPAIVTTNVLYSAVADAMDELNAMDDENPILPTTPEAYTMENGYFIPRSSTEFLTGGALKSVGWGSNVICRKPYTAGTGFVAGDIGREVTESASGDTGTLLDFETEPDGTLVLWIRPEDPATDLFDSVTGTIGVTGDAGTGVSGTLVATQEATTGECLFANVQVIGAVPTATEAYLVQDRVKYTTTTGAFQWWTTDATVATGIVDILVRVQNANFNLIGGFIADGDLEFFARRPGALFDNFRLNVAGGGRSAIPLASAPDINDAIGYRTFTTTDSSGTGTFDVGNGIYVGASWATATARGVITLVGGTGANPLIEYYIVGDLTDLANLDAATEYDFVTAGDGDATTNVATPTNTSGGPADSAAGESASITVNHGDFDVDHDGDGSTEPYSMQIDAQSNVSAAKVYRRIKHLCRRGAGDPFNDTIGLDGELFRGMTLQVAYDGPANVLAEGATIETVTGGNTWTGHSIRNNATASPTYVTMTDDQTSLDSLLNNDVVREIGTPANTVTVLTDGAGYAVRAVTPVKASPFGTYTGTQIFGARGVSYINFASADTQAYTLTDDNGTLRTSPNTVTVEITGLDFTGVPDATDRVFLSPDTGVAGVIDKDMDGGITGTPAIGNATIPVASTIDVERPQAGYIRVVDTGNGDEQRYHYSSFAGTTYTLTAVTDATGTAPATGGLTTLNGTATLWSTGGTPVVPGMLVRNTTDGTVFSEVIDVVSDTELTVTDNGTSWVSQAFEINQTVRAYESTDNIYCPILDGYATATAFSNTLVKTPAANFGAVMNVRQGKVIIPFTQNVTITDTGGSFPAIRTPDTIAT